MSAFWTTKTKEFRKKFALLCNLAFICVFLIQFPVSCMDPGDASFRDVNEKSSFAAYFGGKVPEDVLTGFSNGFLVRFRPEYTAARYRVDGQFGTSVLREYTHLNVVKMTLTVDELRDLATDDAVVWIAPDRDVQASLLGLSGAPDDGLLQVTTGTAQIQSAKIDLLDNPYYTGFTGDGIGVAIFDSGVDPSHADLSGRIAVSKGFVESFSNDGIDDYGHGTHVAGLIAGTGDTSFAQGYDEYIAGIAPDADIINLRVLDESGAGRTSYVLDAIDWVLEHHEAYNIRVANLSLGLPPMSSYKTDPLAVACAQMVQEGIVVVAAAGNYGDYNGINVYGGITSPAYSPYVIAVGAVDAGDSEVRSDDEVAAFSSRGPTLYDGLAKPDLVAPGVAVRSTLARNGYLYDEFPETAVNPCSEGVSCWWGYRPSPKYQELSGTSMAAPVVAGAAALVLQANRSLTPNAVKAILMGTAQVLDGEPYVHQGAGLLNVVGAVDLADNIKNLDEVAPGEDWTFDDVEPVSEIAGEQVVWGQGVGWTGGIVMGPGVVFTYQPVYALDAVWSQGVGWTGGIVWGPSPVWTFVSPVYTGDDTIIGQGVGWTGSIVWTSTPTWTFTFEPDWSDTAVDPMSLPFAGEDVLVNQEVHYDEPVEFLTPESAAYPVQP